MKVPRASEASIVALQRPEIPDTYLFMAAAEMDARGRLFAPKEDDEPTNDELRRQIRREEQEGQRTLIDEGRDAAPEIDQEQEPSVG